MERDVVFTNHGVNLHESHPIVRLIAQNAELFAGVDLKQYSSDNGLYYELSRDAYYVFASVLDRLNLVTGQELCPLLE